MEESVKHCRTDPPNPKNPRTCVGCCSRVCVRLSVDLVARQSPELQMEWAKGQAKLMLTSPQDPDIADGRRLPPQLRQKWEEAQMQTPTGHPKPRYGAVPPPHQTPPEWGAPSIHME